jgi:hypothetical protein
MLCGGCRRGCWAGWTRWAASPPSLAPCEDEVKVSGPRLPSRAVVSSCAGGVSRRGRRRALAGAADSLMAAGCEALGAWDCRHLRCQRSSDGARSPADEPCSQLPAPVHGIHGIPRRVKTVAAPLFCAVPANRLPPPSPESPRSLPSLPRPPRARSPFRALSRIAASPLRRFAASPRLPRPTSCLPHLPHLTLPRPTLHIYVVRYMAASAPHQRHAAF